MAQAFPPSSHPFALAVGRRHSSTVPVGHRRLLPWVGLAALGLFLLLIVHALLYAPDRARSLDLRLMHQVQRIDLPGLGPRLDAFGTLTDSGGAVAAWLVTLVVFALLRWWLPALAVFSLPLGGVINETVSRVIVDRTRPHVDELRRQSLNFEEGSFPSGHVVGAILLYGLIWYVASRRIGFAPLRWLIQLGCGTVVVFSGFNRVWGGAHWPSDVVGACALGLALLVALILICEWIERVAAQIAAGKIESRPQAVSRPLGLDLVFVPVARVVETVLTRHRGLAACLAGRPGEVAYNREPPP